MVLLLFLSQVANIRKRHIIDKKKFKKCQRWSGF